MDFYATLGIPRNADEVAIRSTYRALARSYHPDAGPGANLEKFHEVAEAYETLIDPGRRQAYDLSLQRVVEGERVYAKPRFQQNTSVSRFDLLEELIGFIKRETLFLLHRWQLKHGKTIH